MLQSTRRWLIVVLGTSLGAASILVAACSSSDNTSSSGALPQADSGGGSTSSGNVPESGTSSSGVVQITQDLVRPIEGEDVLIVEDIVDTGLTIAHLIELFHTRHPASLKVCALLHKPARTKVEVPIHYLGFTIEDRFVVGYGLDWAERYRNLPFIGIVETK